MDLDIRQLEVFLAVADSLGFSRAAKSLGMAQASVSERIASLESEIGARLFDRLGRKVALTAAGGRLVEHARALVAARDSAAADLRSFLGHKRGEVLIGGSTAPGEHRLPAILAEIKAAFPEIVPCLEIADSETILDRIEGGRLELGVVGIKSGSENIQSRRLWADRLVLVVSRDHALAAHGGPVSARRLPKERWLVREDGSGTRAEVERALRGVLGKKAVLNVVARLGSATALKNAIAAGMGVAVMSQMTVVKEVAAGALVALELEGFAASRFFHLVRDKRRELSPAAKEVWTHIASSGG